MVERSTKFGFVALQRLSSRHGTCTLASYSKLGYSRLDLDGNMLAKGMCLVRKRKIERCLSSTTEDRHF